MDSWDSINSHKCIWFPGLLCLTYIYCHSIATLQKYSIQEVISSIRNYVDVFSSIQVYLSRWLVRLCEQQPFWLHVLYVQLLWILSLHFLLAGTSRCAVWLNQFIQSSSKSLNVVATSSRINPWENGSVHVSTCIIEGEVCALDIPIEGIGRALLYPQKLQVKTLCINKCMSLNAI